MKITQIRHLFTKSCEAVIFNNRKSKYWCLLSIILFIWCLSADDELNDNREDILSNQWLFALLFISVMYAGEVTCEAVDI